MCSTSLTPNRCPLISLATHGIATDWVPRRHYAGRGPETVTGIGKDCPAAADWDKA